MAESTMSLSRRRRRRLRDLPIIPCCALPLGRRTRPLPVTLKRLAAARLVFIFGMGIRLREAKGVELFRKAGVRTNRKKGPGGGLMDEASSLVKHAPRVIRRFPGQAL